MDGAGAMMLKSTFVKKA
ncbi:hypothetical protein [Thalassomonas actiniarum]